MPIDTVLYDMSYQNVLLYSSILPSSSEKKREKEITFADDPEAAYKYLGIKRKTQLK